MLIKNLVRQPTHPAVFRKSVGPSDFKRFLKHSLLKERQERMKRAFERGNVATSERLKRLDVELRRDLVNHNCPPPPYVFHKCSF
jgi:hypothetical protein